MATIKQKIAIDKIVEKRGNVAAAMREAKYDETTIKNPSNLTQSKAYKKALPSIIARLETERDRALGLLGKKAEKAKYRDLVDATDKLTKNIQLLSGGETERSKVVFMPIELMNKHGINLGTETDS